MKIDLGKVKRGEGLRSDKERRVKNKFQISGLSAEMDNDAYY